MSTYVVSLFLDGTKRGEFQFDVESENPEVLLFLAQEQVAPMIEEYTKLGFVPTPENTQVEIEQL